MPSSSILKRHFGTYECQARPFGECRVVASITDTLALAYARPSHQLEAFTCPAGRPFGWVASIATTLALADARPSHQLEAFTCSASRPFDECRVVASITDTLALAYARPSHQLEAFSYMPSCMAGLLDG